MRDKSLFLQKRRISKHLIWKKVKLGDIVFIQKGQQLNRSTLKESGEYYVQNGGVDPSGYTDKWNTKENTITISEGGNSCGFVKLNKQKFWSGGHCYTLINIDDKIERNFLYYYLKNNEQKIMRLRVGSGIPNIQKKDIEGFLIIYPDLKIQKEISDVLKYKEKEMETLQQLSEKYEEQKKGLMQQLLIEKKRL
ncbi:MAG: restriction endonuclease subunit S [Bdellovibrionales bacterium]|nr:restriction endonuclease subunit S [Bdellovibrionales bacterium]